MIYKFNYINEFNISTKFQKKKKNTHTHTHTHTRARILFVPQKEHILFQFQRFEQRRLFTDIWLLNVRDKHANCVDQRSSL
jgi:hypothetical protein